MKKIKITILTIFTAMTLAFGIGSLAKVKANDDPWIFDQDGYYYFNWNIITAVQSTKSFSLTLNNFENFTFEYRVESPSPGSWISLNLENNDELKIERHVGQSGAARKIYVNGTTKVTEQNYVLTIRYKEIPFESRWELDQDGYYNFIWIFNNTFTVTDMNFSEFDFEYYHTDTGWKELKIGNLNTLKVSSVLSSSGNITEKIYIDDEVKATAYRGPSGGVQTSLGLRYKPNNISRFNLGEDGYNYFQWLWNDKYTLDWDNDDYLFEYKETGGIWTILEVDSDTKIRLEQATPTNGQYTTRKIFLDGVLYLEGKAGNVPDSNIIEFRYIDIDEIDDPDPIDPDPEVPEGYRIAIDGEENFVTNYDDPKPVEFFQAFLIAFDETDGDISDEIYIKTNDYTENMAVLGAHKVVFAVKDSNENETTLEVYIRVVDITAPVITGNTSQVNIGYKETWNINNFKNSLNVTDNHDDSVSLKAAITIESDGYTANKTTLGTYDVVFSVEDQSGNIGTFTKTIKVIDNVAPTFSGPTSLTSNISVTFTESDVRNQLTAYDEKEGNVTHRIEVDEDNYTGKGHNTGIYTIKYRVTDTAGNEAFHTVTINRRDDIPPVFYIKDGVSIVTDTSTPLTIDDIINILTRTGQVVIPVGVNAMFSVQYDDYTGNEDQVGVYTVVIDSELTNGDESTHTMSINVLESSDGIPVDGPEAFFQKYKGVIIAGVILLVVAIGYVYFKKPNRKRRY